MIFEPYILMRARTENARHVTQINAAPGIFNKKITVSITNIAARQKLSGMSRDSIGIEIIIDE